MILGRIQSAMDMEARVVEMGFLPFFPCGIPGLSIQEMTPRSLWFSDEEEGPWEWKGPVIKEGHCAYGKIFNRKAGYVSLEWLPDLMNYRRSKQLAQNEDIAALDDIVLQTIEIEGSATIKDLRRILDFAKGRGKRKRAQTVGDLLPEEEKISLEPILTRLMMQLRIVTSDFEYNIDRRGNPYGWGIARYTTPENLYGRLTVNRTPEESFDRIYHYLRGKFPYASEKKLLTLIG